MKHLFTLLFLCSVFSAFSQFRMVGNVSGSWTSVNDSTYTGTVNFQSDLTGMGYLATAIADTFKLFTPTEQMYLVDSIWGQTFSSASMRVIRRNGAGSPVGQCLVFNPDGRQTIPNNPFGSTGATAQLNAAVDAWNARQISRGKVYILDENNDTSDIVSPKESDVALTFDFAKVFFRDAYGWREYLPPAWREGYSRVSNFNVTASSVKNSLNNVWASNVSAIIRSTATADNTVILCDIDSISSGQIYKIHVSDSSATYSYSIVPEISGELFVNGVSVSSYVMSDQETAVFQAVRTLSNQKFWKLVGTSKIGISDGEVTNAKLADMPTNTIKGDIGAGVVDLNATQVSNLLATNGVALGWKYVFSTTAPSDTTVVWVDNSAANTVNQAYPLRFRLNGDWTAVSKEKNSTAGLWYDPVGKTISRGYPLVILVSGQSNPFGPYIAQWSPNPAAAPYNSYYGDTKTDPYVTVWDSTLNSFKVYTTDTIVGASGVLLGRCCSSGSNMIQIMAKEAAKETGRTVRIIGNGRGGTAIERWSGVTNPNNAQQYQLLKAAVLASNITYVDIFVWGQGEQGDSLVSPSYYTQFYTFLDTLRNQPFMKTDTKVLVTGLGFTASVAVGGNGNSNELDLKKIGLDDDFNTAFVPVTLIEVDGIHITPRGHEVLGRRLWQYSKELPLSKVKGGGINTSPNMLSILAGTTQDTLAYLGSFKIGNENSYSYNILNLNASKFYGDGSNNSAGTGSINTAGLRLSRFANGGAGQVYIADYFNRKLDFGITGVLSWANTFQAQILTVASAGNPGLLFTNVNGGGGTFEIRNVNVDFALETRYGSTKLTGLKNAGYFNIGFTAGAGLAPDARLSITETRTTEDRGILGTQHNTGSHASVLRLRKTRNSAQTPSIIVVGDTLARIIIEGFDGTNNLASALIEVLSVGTVAATRVPTKMSFKTATDAAPSVLIEALNINESQVATFSNPIVAPILDPGNYFTNDTQVDAFQQLGAADVALQSDINTRILASSQQRGSVSTTTDASGDATVNHTNIDDSFIVLVQVTGTSAVYHAQVHSETGSDFKIRFYDMTGAAVADTTPVTFYWKLENR